MGAWGEWVPDPWAAQPEAEWEPVDLSSWESYTGSWTPNSAGRYDGGLQGGNLYKRVRDSSPTRYVRTYYPSGGSCSMPDTRQNKFCRTARGAVHLDAGQDDFVLGDPAWEQFRWSMGWKALQAAEEQ